MAKEYIEREMTCGDCIHADVCEEAETLPEFNRENVAYCGMFMKAADVVEVVRCKDCVHYDFGVCLKIYSDGAVSQYAWQARNNDDFCSYGEKRDDNADD